MTAEVRPVGRHPGRVVLVATARRAARSAAVWGLLFGALAANEALSWSSSFATPESRTQFAEGFASNKGLAAVTGVGRRLDTIQGFVAWRVFGLVLIVGAVWGLLTATRLLRGEEDAGRWELLLAGRTDRRRATAQALGGLAAGLVLMWVLTSVLLVVAGTRPSADLGARASWFYATALVAAAALFLAVGAVVSQLAATRRQANGLGAAVLTACLVVRMVADTADGLGWLRWASPLGWVEELRPLTGSQPLALVPIAGLVGACAVGAVVLAGRRDVGSAALAAERPARSRLSGLDSPEGLAIRLERWVVVAWVVGVGALAVVFGVVARSASAAGVADESVGEVVSRLGGQAGGAAAWLGYEFLYLVPLVAFAAAGQIAAMRSEEADGRLDGLLARPVSRTRWVVGRLGVALAMVLLAGLACGLGGWLGVLGAGEPVALGRMLQAALNVAAPAVLVLGLGTLLFGVLPRLAAPLLYAFVLWSFVVQVLASGVVDNRWVLDTSFLTHLAPVPAADPRWPALAILALLGLLGAATGLLAFGRRDLASA